MRDALESSCGNDPRRKNREDKDVLNLSRPASFHLEPAEDRIASDLDWDRKNDRLIVSLAAFLAVSGYFLLASNLGLQGPTAAAAATLPGLILIGWSISADRRAKARFLSRLPEVAKIVARCLRQGQGLTDAYRTVAAQLPSPIREEFMQLAMESGDKMKQESGLTRFRSRWSNPAATIFALLLQNDFRTGLANRLEEFADREIQHRKMVRDVQTLLERGSGGAGLLLMIPGTAMLVITHVAPRFPEPLFILPLGRWLAVAGAIALIATVVVVQRLLSVRM